MYEFTDINEVPGESFPSVAMSFNGVFFENEIEGYRTLNVGGRELMGVVLEVATGVGKDGSAVISTSMPSRTLIIEYMLRAESSEELRQKFNRLNRLLRTDDGSEVVVSFTDEPDRHFYGHFEAANEVPFDRNIVRGSFTIFCPFPYKFSTMQTFVGANDIGNTKTFLVIPAGFTDYPAKPDYFYYIPATTMAEITIRNESTGQELILTGDTGDYAAGDEFVINYPDDEITQSDGTTLWNIMFDLDYVNSDFHNFRVFAGNTISVTPPGAFSVMLEGWFL